MTEGPANAAQEAGSSGSQPGYTRPLMPGGWGAASWELGDGSASVGHVVDDQRALGVGG